MKSAVIPEHEAARLANLASYAVLDTAAEPAFDSLTTLTAELLHAPVALISLVDATRQWLKSRHGVDVQEVPRDVSFCKHVVADEAAVIVEDTWLDPRFTDSPLVRGEPYVRFYAGVPLSSDEGFVIGTLCAIGFEPRSVGLAQVNILTSLARQVVALLALRRGTHGLHEQQAALKERERELAESDARMRAVFDSLAEGVTMQLANDEIVACNESAPGILGLSRDQLFGRTSTDSRWQAIYEHGATVPGEEFPSSVTMRTGKPVTNFIMGIRKPDDALAWLSVNARPVCRAGEALPYTVVTAFRDVSEERSAAERAARLSRQERLVTTGTLAAGVGHEINNPLTHLLSNVEFALDELRTGGQRADAVLEALVDAVDGVERIRKIVRGLKALARDDGPPRVTALTDVLDVAIDITMHEMRTRATIKVELPPLPTMLVNDSQLAQVMVNLLLNAAQAFVEDDPARNCVIVRAQASERHVAISVTDNGPGIAADVLAHIFDPFFTTKPVGQGTGLGLSISHSIVTGLGGELGCETCVGRGTTFTIRLPLVAETETPSIRSSMVSPIRRGRVLLIDDDRIIARALARVVRRDHEVLAINDPREAVEVLASGARFDVIFCDLMMPFVTGPDVYRQALALDCELAKRFVFITGGVMRADIVRFLGEVPNVRIEKPLSVEHLREVIRRFMRVPDPGAVRPAAVGGNGNQSS